jgi:TolB-like protein
MSQPDEPARSQGAGAPAAPSVFLSYATADRAAARALRDVLVAAGLEVWYDESELMGGDAWDQKIRRQIRECDYFMPLISANTEVRKEGYFRREWRLAVERTLDMADDVLFLVPVALDDTAEEGARVPERFLTVQWLRAPGGRPNPASATVLERLRAGDHRALPRRAAGPTRAPFSAPTAPPPMPPFPPVPDRGGLLHAVKFFAEVMWWGFTAAWTVLLRLPRWARILVGVWIILMLFSTVQCTRVEERPNSAGSRGGAARPPGEGKRTRNAAAVQKREAAATPADGLDLGRLASEIAHVFGEGFSDGPPTGKPLVVIPFSRPNDESPGGKFAHSVFLSLYGRLVLERRSDVSVVAPLRGEPSPAVLQARAAALGAGLVLAASVQGEGERQALTARLYSAADSKVIWTQSFPLRSSDDDEVAARIAAKALEQLPAKAQRQRKGP